MSTPGMTSERSAYRGSRFSNGSAMRRLYEPDRRLQSSTRAPMSPTLAGSPAGWSSWSPTMLTFQRKPRSISSSTTSILKGLDCGRRGLMIPPWSVIPPGGLEYTKHQTKKVWRLKVWLYSLRAAYKTLHGMICEFLVSKETPLRHGSCLS